jgi:hypothetical protein
MSDQEIVLWLDERWYTALQSQLKDVPVEEKLNEYLSQLIDQLPSSVYEKISKEISEEERQRQQEAEANRQFSVFHITEGGTECYFMSENRGMDMLRTANLLRNYVREQTTPGHLPDTLNSTQPLTEKEFLQFASERREKTGRVTGAFGINMDKGEFSELNIIEGWQVFHIKDICAAAYYALRKESASWDEQCARFLERLDGKQLIWCDSTELVFGSRRLTLEDISFSDEIMWEDRLLNFYMDVAFEPDEVFGAKVCTAGSDDYVNAYVNYDLEQGCVCDRLELDLVRRVGPDRSYQYQLSDEEKSALRSKMESYCQEKMRRSLEDCRTEYLAEQSKSTQRDEPTVGEYPDLESEDDPELGSGPELGMQF